MVNKMEKEEYKILVKKHSPKENRLKNIGVAFFVGGCIGFASEFLVEFLKVSFGMNNTDACLWVSLIIILVSSIFTGLGFFDNWVGKARCGLIIPTSGFAHCVASSALDYKKDGLVTGLGANFFKLAGSVILYGIISAFLLVIVRVVISG